MTKRSTARNSSGRLAGWLFADILLVLAVIGLAGSDLAAKPNTEGGTTTTTTTTTTQPEGGTVPTTPSSTTLPSLDLEAQSLEFKLSARDASDRVFRDLDEALDTYLAFTDQTERRVGFVIILSGDSTTSRRAIDLSESVATHLRNTRTEFSGSAHRAYWTSESYGYIKLEVFFYD